MLGWIDGNEEIISSKRMFGNFSLWREKKMSKIPLSTVTLEEEFVYDQGFSILDGSFEKRKQPVVLQFTFSLIIVMLFI